MRSTNSNKFPENIIENCSGCPGFEDSMPRCSHFNVHGACPCTNCIIETICTTDCKSFKSRYNSKKGDVHRLWFRNIRFVDLKIR